MKLYNTPDKKVVELKLDKTKPVKIYTCGPTVYDFPHIGNWYTFIRYDLLARVLRASGHKINWVMNVTDVGHLVSDADTGEDKLEKGAKREGKSAWDVAKTYTTYFSGGLKRLNFSNVDHLPKATDYIQDQIELVEKLEQAGYTYITTDGVYFDTSKFPSYADFAHLNLEGQKTGTRVEITDDKHNEADFALWKFSPKGQKRDMEWNSPWGKGFPGWHLECSAMIHKLLGEPIDIHAGGVDHLAVHHTNEIAQSAAAFGTPLSRYWMHCNHILVDSKKMSKSDGTFITLEDIEAKGFEPLDLRQLVLQSHYRFQSNFSWDALESAKNSLHHLREWADLRYQSFSSQGMAEYNDSAWKKVLQKLQDDLRLPDALTYLYGAIQKVDELGPDSQSIAIFAQNIDEVFGLNLCDSSDITDNQKEVLGRRKSARDKEDWTEADKLRDELKEQGIAVKDSDSGQIWSRVV